MKIKDYGLKFKSLSRRASTQFLVLHHTGTCRPGTDWSAQRAHECHLGKGWSGCGYHYIIRKSGDIERGRPEDMIGSHCLGVNAKSIGIHLSGDFNCEAPTAAQINSLVELAADICIRRKIQSKDIFGHRDKSASDCPGKNLYALLPGIRKKVHDKILELKK